MQNKVRPVGLASDSPYGQAAGGASASAAKPGPAPKEDLQLRLVIEEDLAAQSYVYKTINSRTGEIVHQYPREEVLRMREDANYHAGGVISTKA